MRIFFKSLKLENINEICRRKEKKNYQSFILFELLVFKSFIILVSFDVRDEDLSVDTHNSYNN
jgi:hypothetical protein